MTQTRKLVKMRLTFGHTLSCAGAQVRRVRSMAQIVEVRFDPQLLKVINGNCLASLLQSHLNRLESVPSVTSSALYSQIAFHFIYRAALEQNFKHRPSTERQ